MSSYPRMKRLFQWKPLVKKGTLPANPSWTRTEQYSGLPSWLLLTHDSKGAPEALLVDGQERVESLRLVLDERLFSDTVMRVVRLSPNMLVAYDLVTLNGSNFHATHTYAQRRERIRELLDLFHYPDLVSLIPVEDVPEGTPLRGYEYYDDKPGSLGTFLPVDE